MIHQLPKPTIFAHRGSSAYAPENTLEAFEVAIQQGADAIELDAKLTRDGHVVVIHDQTLERTTSGKGKVEELTLKEIQALDAGSYFDPCFHTSRVPSLEEVLATFGKQTMINIELTNYASIFDELPERVAELIQKMDLQGHVLLSSFNPVALRRVKRLLPQVPVGLLTLPGKAGVWARKLVPMFVSVQSLHPEKSAVDAKLLRVWQGQQKRVFAYTINEASEMERLFRLGVDGIFTDDPPKALEVRARLSSENATRPEEGQK